MSRLVLFEDDRAGWFEPVALTRTVARLRLGAWTHRERWERLCPGRRVALICRGPVVDVERERRDWTSVNEESGDDTLFVAAALGWSAITYSSRPSAGVRDARWSRTRSRSFRPNGSPSDLT